MKKIIEYEIGDIIKIYNELTFDIVKVCMISEQLEKNYKIALIYPDGYLFCKLDSKSWRCITDEEIKEQLGMKSSYFFTTKDKKHFNIDV